MKQNKKSRICKKKVGKLTPNLYQRIMCRGKDLSFSDSLARLYSKKWTVSRSITFHFPAFSSHSFEALLRRFNLRKEESESQILEKEKSRRKWKKILRESEKEKNAKGYYVDAKRENTMRHADEAQLCNWRPSFNYPSPII